MTQLQALLGEDGIRWAIWIGLGFAALLGLLLLIFILKRIFAPAFNMSSSSDRRGRPPRLGVTDFFNLDRAGRRLVIVRRDNVEHLVLVGGPNDILIESNILRGVRPEAPVVDSSGRPMIQPRQADLASIEQPAADPAPARETFASQKKRTEAPPVELRAIPGSSPMQAPLRTTASDEDRLMADIGSMAAAASASVQPAGFADPIAAPPVRQAIRSEAASTPSPRTPTTAAPQQRASAKPELARPEPANLEPAKPDAAPPAPAIEQPSGDMAQQGVQRQQTDVQLNPQPLPPVAPTAPEPRTLPRAAPAESVTPDLLSEGVARERTLPEGPSPAEDAPIAPVSVAPRRTASFEDVSKRLQEALRRPQPLASSAVTTSSARNAAIPSTLKPASFGPGKPAQAEPAHPSPPAGESAAAAALPPAPETRPAPSSTDSALSQIEELDLEQEMARLLGRVPGAKP